MTRLSVLAVIPARAGSKAVPKKNIALVAGRPLVAYTITAARAARGLDRVIVSTDSEEIARVARDWGAEAPFLRPAALARDGTPGVPPILHAVSWLERNESYRPDAVMCLQPTSPLRTAEDIEAAIRLMQRKRAESVVSVAIAPRHPLWMKRLSADGRLRPLTARQPLPRRQVLPPVYALNGAIYLVRRDALVRQRSWYPSRTYAYVMPWERSLDVDTPWDVALADLILSRRVRGARMLATAV